jgi:nitrogenase iron protein NifH
VRAFAQEHGLEIVGEIPRSDDIIRFEEEGKTVIEGDPSLEVSRTFLDLAQRLLETEG